MSCFVSEIKSVFVFIIILFTVAKVCVVRLAIVCVTPAQNGVLYNEMWYFANGTLSLF